MSSDVDSDREDLFQILTRGLWKKYADKKQFFRTLLLHGHVGLFVPK